MIETNFHATCSQISQLSEIDSAVKATFQAIFAAMSVVCNNDSPISNSKPTQFFLQVQSYHYTQLQEDAAASLGTNHFIFKTAAHYVDASEKPLMAGLGISPSDWHSVPFREMREQSYKAREAELLKWAGIDLPGARIM